MNLSFGLGTSSLKRILTAGSPPPPPPFVLLDEAAAFFSVRKGERTVPYEGSVLRVRRTGDNAEAEIGFSGNHLDETSLLGFAGRENILLNSGDFARGDFTTGWSGPSTSETRLYPDPLGQVGAHRVSNKVTSSTSTNESASVPADGQEYTFSVYAKSGTSTQIELKAVSLPVTTSATFDLQTGTVISTLSGANLTFTSSHSQSVGGGWFRFGVSFISELSGSGANRFDIVITGSSGGSFAYLFGAQVTQSSSMVPYVETFDSPATGDGYVTRWYNQATGISKWDLRSDAFDSATITWNTFADQDNDSFQTIGASQVKVVSSGAVVEENGRPALDFDGVNDAFLINDFAYTTTALFTSAVFKRDGVGAIFSHYDFGASQRAWAVRISTNSTFWSQSSSSGTLFNVADGGSATAFQKLWTNQFDGSLTGADRLKGYVNGSQLTYTQDGISTEPLPSSLHNSTASLAIGCILNSGVVNTAFNGKIQELLLYSSDQEPNRADIESNVNAYFSIYP